MSAVCALRYVKIEKQLGMDFVVLLRPLGHSLRDCKGQTHRKVRTQSYRSKARATTAGLPVLINVNNKLRHSAAAVPATRVGMDGAGIVSKRTDTRCWEQTA